MSTVPPIEKEPKGLPEESPEREKVINEALDKLAALPEKPEHSLNVMPSQVVKAAEKKGSVTPEQIAKVTKRIPYESLRMVA